MSTNRIVGLLLIALGGALLLVTTTELGGEVLLALVGLAFLVAYGATRTYGFLVPGGIVTGLAGGIIAAEQGAPGAAVVLGLGCGFLFIAAVDRVLGAVGPGWWWPTIPGGILLVIAAAALTGIEDLPAYLVPAALIVVGAVLLLRRGDDDATTGGQPGGTGTPGDAQQAPPD